MTMRLVDVRSLLLRRYLARQIAPLRRGDFIDRGMNLNPARLKRHVRRSAWDT